MKVQTATAERFSVDGQDAPGGRGDIAVLWSSGPTSCVLSWIGDRYRVRLVRSGRLLRDDFELDERMAMAVGRSWQAAAALGAVEHD
jgi:hypothetical protein